MNTYTVKWEIELDAESPREAAEEAYDCCVNGTAKVYSVMNNRTSEIELVDLEEIEEEE